jgi:hypothetical protein
MGSWQPLRQSGMADGPCAPRARIELLAPGRAVDLGPIAPVAVVDGALVDDLLRFDLAARRLGWRLRLHDVDDHLAEVLDLIGVADRIASRRPSADVDAAS